MLLLLTQHLPPALFPSPTATNPYLSAIRSLGDEADPNEQQCYN